MRRDKGNPLLEKLGFYVKYDDLDKPIYCKSNKQLMTEFNMSSVSIRSALVGPDEVVAKTKKSKRLGALQITSQRTSPFSSPRQSAHSGLNSPKATCVKVKPRQERRPVELVLTGKLPFITSPIQGNTKVCFP